MHTHRSDSLSPRQGVILNFVFLCFVGVCDFELGFFFVLRGVGKQQIKILMF